MATHGPPRVTSHRGDSRPPSRSRPRVRRRARPCIERQPRARALPIEGRWRELGARAACQRTRRCRRRVARPQQPAHHLCHHLADPPHVLVDRQRWPRQWSVAFARRRRHVGEHQSTPRHARRHPRQDRRLGVAGTLRSGLRDGRSRGPQARPLPFRRHRRDLGEGVIEPRSRLAPVVLPTRHRPPHRCRRDVRHEHEGMEIGRRRQDVRGVPHATWRQPRAVDRPREPRPHDRLRRRWGLGVVQRRHIVVDDLQPADRAVLPRRHRRPISLPGVRLAAGQLEHRSAQPGRSWRHQLGRLLCAGHRRERVRGAQARRPEHRVRGRDR